LEREPSEQLVDVDDLRLVDLALDGHRPGAGPQRARVLRGVSLARSKLVEVVVARDVAVRGPRLLGAVVAGAGDRELRLAWASPARARRLRLRPASPHQPKQAAANGRTRRREEHGVAHELAPSEVQRL